MALRSTSRCIQQNYAWAKDHLSPGISRNHQLLIDRGQGAYLWTEEGKKFLDFGMGIGTVNLGHCHPRLVKVVQQQAEKLWHSPHPFGVHTALRNLIAEMEKVVPRHLTNFMFTTTGAEAVEAALKVARQATGRQNTVVLQGSFHGRTVATAAMTTSKYVYARNMRPLMPGVVTIPIPYFSQLHSNPSENVGEVVKRVLAQVHDILHQQTHPTEVSMLIAEPELGEGGYLPLPAEFLLGLQDICKKNGIVFVMDEVQTGYGRTGSFWNHQQVPGLEPDIMVFAKGVGNGLPLSGIVSRQEFANKCLPGSMGGTYGGNVLAAASATEVLKVFEDEKVLDNVKARSKQLREGVIAMVERNRFPVLEVRGRGLMLGIQMRSDLPSGTASKLVDACTDRGLIVMNTSIYETLRLIPPLNLKEVEASEALGILEGAMKHVFAGVQPVSAAKFKPCCATPCQQLDGSYCRYTASE